MVGPDLESAGGTSVATAIEFARDDCDSEWRLLLSLAVGVYVHVSWVPFLRHNRQG